MRQTEINRMTMSWLNRPVAAVVSLALLCLVCVSTQAHAESINSCHQIFATNSSKPAPSRVSTSRATTLVRELAELKAARDEAHSNGNHAIARLLDAELRKVMLQARKVGVDLSNFSNLFGAVRGEQKIRAEQEQTTRTQVKASETKLRPWLPVTTLHGRAHDFIDATFSPDSTRVLTAFSDGVAALWDVATGQLLREFNWEGQVLNWARLNHDGSRIVTISNSLIAIWDASTGQRLLEFKASNTWVDGARFSPDGAHLITASFDRTARLWDVTTGRLVREFQGHEGFVNDAHFSSDGTRLVTAGSDRTARIWNVSTGELLHVLTGHDARVSGADFSSDGSRIVTAASDDKIRVWDSSTGQLLLTIAAGEGATFYDASFSPDGSRIVTSFSNNSPSGGGTARIWDSTSGQLLDEVKGHTDLVFGSSFSPDGSRLITRSSDKTVRIWELAD